MTLNDRNTAHAIVSEYESTRNDLHNAALVVFRNPRGHVDFIEDVASGVDTFLEGEVFPDVYVAFRTAQKEKNGPVDEENMKEVGRYLTTKAA